jgi:predicted molibdopterin-dependent oxidoreductase YjgC
MGVGALGLVHRGFDSLVKPEFGRPLQDSACISCGQCVSVCPTGALIERNTHLKNVPLAMDEVNSHCSFCGLGCGQVISSRGDSVFKIVPDQGESLCTKGRFGFAAAQTERLRTPLLRVGGELQECSWDEDLTYIAKKSLAVKAKSGVGSIALFASPALTLEEAQLAASWQDLLATDKLASFSPDCGRGLVGVLGENQATNCLDEMAGTNLVVMLGSFNQNQVLPARIRKAVGQGAALKAITPGEEAQLTQGIVDGAIKAAYILGEDPVGAGLIDKQSLYSLEFLMVASPFMTQTAEAADVVLPLSTALENDGTYMTADGTVVSLRSVKDAPAGKNNLDIWADLSLVMNPLWSIGFEYPDSASTGAYKYARNFDNADGKAQLSMGKDEAIFVPVKITDPTLIKFRG